MRSCRLSANLKLCRKRRRTAVNPDLHQPKPGSKSRPYFPVKLSARHCMQVRSNKKLAKARTSFNHCCCQHSSELMTSSMQRVTRVYWQHKALLRHSCAGIRGWDVGPRWRQEIAKFADSAMSGRAPEPRSPGPPLPSAAAVRPPSSQVSLRQSWQPWAPEPTDHNKKRVRLLECLFRV